MAWWEWPPLRLPAETDSIYYDSDVWGIQPYSQGRPRGRVRQPHAGRRDHSRRPRLLRRRLARGHRLLDEVDDRPRAVLQDVLAVRHAQQIS